VQLTSGYCNAPPQELWSILFLCFVALLTSKECSRPSQAINCKNSANPLVSKNCQRRRTTYDFGVGYDCADVCEEGERSVIPSNHNSSLAFLCVVTYTYPLLDYISTYTPSTPSCSTFILHVFQAQYILQHTTIVMVLGLTRPEELYTLHAWIERWVQGNGTRKLEEERRKQCASILLSSLPLFLLCLFISGKAHLRHDAGPSAEC
jgi:hypothetical protein